MARAKQQESAESNFKFVEKRSLLSTLSEDTKQLIQNTIIPLRHYEWGANMNNYQICAMGYGAAITSAASLHGSDRLGNAQYITRIGLSLADNDVSAIDAAKIAWTDDEKWQGLRKVVEDSLVVDDWFELFVAQNLVMDGMVLPLFFQKFEEQMNASGATAYTMLTEFTTNWYTESSRWVDKQIAVATAESDANKQLVNGWFNNWIDEVEKALVPLAEASLENGAEALADIKATLLQRATKNGISQ
jgi:phenol hydroxylase P1 protein